MKKEEIGIIYTLSVGDVRVFETKEDAIAAGNENHWAAEGLQVRSHRIILADVETKPSN